MIGKVTTIHDVIPLFIDVKVIDSEFSIFCRGFLKNHSRENLGEMETPTLLTLASENNIMTSSPE